MHSSSIRPAFPRPNSALACCPARPPPPPPSKITGPKLTASQEKFLAFLLQAPTLSYSGGLFLLQAFQGRSSNDVVAR